MHSCKVQSCFTREKSVCLLGIFTCWLLLFPGWGFSMGTKYHFHSWRVFVLVCSLPCIASLVALKFMPESPRFLLEVRWWFMWTSQPAISRAWLVPSVSLSLFLCPIKHSVQAQRQRHYYACKVSAEIAATPEAADYDISQGWWVVTSECGTGRSHRVPEILDPTKAFWKNLWVWACNRWILIEVQRTISASLQQRWEQSPGLLTHLLFSDLFLTLLLPQPVFG